MNVFSFNIFPNNNKMLLLFIVKICKSQQFVIQKVIGNNI